MQDVTYLDFRKEGARLCKLLRSEGCDFVIALTHMRMPNDRLLRESVPDIDLIAGGHDHHYEVCAGLGHGPVILNSGTDFRDLTVLQLRVSDDSAAEVRLLATQFS